MLYYLFDYLAETGIPGSRLMNYITFRSGAAFVLALFIAMVFGRRIIDRLQLMQVASWEIAFLIAGATAESGSIPLLSSFLIRW